MIPDWKSYTEARRAGLKKQWKELLAQRLGYLDSLNENDAKEYLNNLCHYYFDLDETEIPIQHPQIWNKVLGLWQGQQIWDDSKLLFWLAKSLTSTKGGFKGAYLLLNKHPSDILRRIIELNPNHVKAKRLLFEQNIDALDFAMHSIDSGMLIEKCVGDKLIAECEALIKSEPSLNNCKTRFGGDFEYYKSRFIAFGFF